MADYVIVTTKSWNMMNSRMMADQYPEHHFTIITEKYELTCDVLAAIKPKYIFFPHWSWIIPADIYKNFECVVFHMTDLPFGRGGSPLQNLLVRGIYKTKISAIRVGRGMDTGPVYCKEPVDISEGNAEEILRKVSDIVFLKMIPRFLEEDMEPKAQEGEPVEFRRRIPAHSEIPDGLSQRQIYDYIRMLDGEGYPTAYKRMSDGKIYYRNARYNGDIVYADAEFRRDT